MSARIIAAGMLALALLRSCAAEGESGAAGAPVEMKRDVTFHADWSGSTWYNITLILGGDARGPYEKRTSFERVERVAVGTDVTIVVILAKGQPSPGPLVHCHVRVGTLVLDDNDQRGECRAEGVVPPPETRA